MWTAEEACVVHPVMK